MPQDDSPVRCPEFSIERKWQVTVQTPEAALGDLVSAIQGDVALIQGAYSLCMLVRKSGKARFKNRAGAHDGKEEFVREVPSAEIVLAIPYDAALLERAIRFIAWHHLHEEPTISVVETWEYLSGPDEKRENPNRYWNREDRDEIHGISAGPSKPAKTTSRSRP